MLSRLLSLIFPDPSGLEAEEPDPIRLDAPATPGAVLRALPHLVDVADAVLYWEGAADQRLAAWLRRAAGEPRQGMVAGINPVRDFYHLSPTPELLDELARWLTTGRTPTRVRLHLQERGRIVFEWRRAFARSPLFLSRSIPEERLAVFLEASGLVTRGRLLDRATLDRMLDDAEARAAGSKR